MKNLFWKICKFIGDIMSRLRNLVAGIGVGAVGAASIFLLGPQDDDPGTLSAPELRNATVALVQQRSDSVSNGLQNTQVAIEQALSSFCAGLETSAQNQCTQIRTDLQLAVSNQSALESQQFSSLIQSLNTLALEPGVGQSPTPTPDPDPNPDTGASASFNISTNRSTCVAPCAPHFTPTNFQNFNVNDPETKIDVRWSFGETVEPFRSLPSGHRWNDQNKAMGHLTAPLYRAAGTYTATATALTAAGVTATATINTVVLDPDSVFAGDKTIMIDDGDDCALPAPDGALTVASIDEAMDLINANNEAGRAARSDKRFLLCADGEYSYGGNREIRAEDNIQFVKYGAGANPQVAISGTPFSVFTIRSASNIVFLDVDFVGTYDAATGLGDTFSTHFISNSTDGPNDNVLIAGGSFSGFNHLVFSSAPQNGWTYYDIAVTDWSNYGNFHGSGSLVSVVYRGVSMEQDPDALEISESVGTIPNYDQRHFDRDLVSIQLITQAPGGGIRVTAAGNAFVDGHWVSLFGTGVDAYDSVAGSVKYSDAENVTETTFDLPDIDYTVDWSGIANAQRPITPDHGPWRGGATLGGVVTIAQSTLKSDNGWSTGVGSGNGTEPPHYAEQPVGRGATEGRGSRTWLNQLEARGGTSVFAFFVQNENTIAEDNRFILEESYLTSSEQTTEFVATTYGDVLVRNIVTVRAAGEPLGNDYIAPIRIHQNGLFSADNLAQPIVVTGNTFIDLSAANDNVQNYETLRLVGDDATFDYQPSNNVHHAPNRNFTVAIDNNGDWSPLDPANDYAPLVGSPAIAGGVANQFLIRNFNGDVRIEPLSIGAF